MVKNERPWYRKPWFLIGAVAVLLVGLLFVAATVTLVSLGVNLDPTSSVFTLAVENDTSSTVVLKQCDVACNAFHEEDRLSPGERVNVNTSAADVPNWWLIADMHGTVLGCLNLQYSHKITGLVVHVSSMGTCPQSRAKS